MEKGTPPKKSGKNPLTGSCGRRRQGDFFAGYRLGGFRLARRFFQQEEHSWPWWGRGRDRPQQAQKRMLFRRR